MPPKRALHNFQERPPGAARMQETLLSAGSPPRTLLGELIKLEQNPIAGVEGARCPLPQEPHLRWALALRVSTLAK